MRRAISAHTHGIAIVPRAAECPRLEARGNRPSARSDKRRTGNPRPLSWQELFAAEGVEGLLRGRVASLGQEVISIEPLAVSRPQAFDRNAAR